MARFWTEFCDIFHHQGPALLEFKLKRMISPEWHSLQRLSRGIG